MELNVGDVFSSFAELESKVQTYQTENSVQLWKRDSRTIASARKRLPNRNFNPDIKYHEIIYSCVHGGRKHSSSSTGVRPNASTSKMDCPYQLKLRSSEDGQHLVIIKHLQEHNHEISQPLFNLLPSQRRLDQTDKNQVAEMLKTNADRKLIRQQMSERTGKAVTMKDIHNIATSYKLKTPSTTSELQQIGDFLSSQPSIFTGLTAGDDRGSSEYSQNDDEAAASGSPEFLGDGNERDPTPTPVAQTPPKPESYQLRHNNHLTIVLEALARDEAFMDVTLTAQGRSLKAHKSVLSAVSPYFRGVLRENPCQHPIIIMPRDVRFEELFSIVNYIYKGEMTVAADDLTSLLKTAEILQVSGLAPSDSTATVNPHTAANIRSSSSSSSASSNVPPVAKMPKTVKETNQGISAPVTRPKSPETMINPSDFMDMDMTYVKEEVQSGGEDDDEEVTPSETPAQPSGNASPKATEISQDSVTFTSVYNQNQEQTSGPSNSSQEANNIPIKTEADMDGRSTVEQDISITKIPQPFVCPHCQGVHRGFENLNNHLRLNHPTKPSFPCAACGRVFTRSAAHQAHVNECNVSS